MLIVLEGLDGAGKSTQVRMLREYLQQKCGDLEYIHFPRYDAPVYGELISKFLRGDFGDIDQVHPQLVALLYAEDRHGAADCIKEQLRDGKTVLLDRYVYSNIAYQGAKFPSPAEAEDLRQWIMRTEFDIFEEPKPTLNIFLDVPLGFVEQNLNKERKGDDREYLHGSKDIHEASMDFQRRVRDMYLHLAEHDNTFKIVKCSCTDGSMEQPSVIFDKIKQLVDEIL